MAINEAIVEKISKLDIDNEAKEMLLELLKFQERGGRQYTKQYTAIINKYLESDEND